MKLVCPRKNHADWIYSVEKLGVDKTLFLYDLLKQEIPTKEQVDIAVKKFEKESGIIKEGVDIVFKDTPKLSIIGNKEQYSKYLDTIFPNSKVKYILYHGTPTKFDTEKFSKEMIGKEMDSHKMGFFFTNNRMNAYEYMDETNERTREDHRPFMYSVLLDIHNPLVQDRAKRFDNSIKELAIRRIRNSLIRLNHTRDFKFTSTDGREFKVFITYKSIDKGENVFIPIIEISTGLFKPQINVNDPLVPLDVRNKIIKEYNEFKEDVKNLTNKFSAANKLTDIPFIKRSNYDSVIQENTLGDVPLSGIFTQDELNLDRESEPATNNYVVFEPEQIHILGSEKDINKFKEFIENDTPININEHDAFIDRMNSHIENGMYKEKSGKLVPITDSYNPETWWIENLEDLVDFDHGHRNEHLFRFDTVHGRIIELNKKYKDQGYVFNSQQVIFPAVTVAKSKNPVSNSRKIYKINLTKPLIRTIDSNETYHTEKDVWDAIKESNELVRTALKSMENKTMLEVIDIVRNLEIDDEVRTLLDIFANKLVDNPTLKFVINNTEENEFGNYDGSTNTITMYTLGHIDKLSSSINNIGITLSHELLHAFTVRALYNRYTPKEIEFAETMTRLFEIAKKQTKYSKLEAYKSVEEWTARVLTQAKIMEEAKRMKLDIFSRIIKGIKRLLGIPSVYDQALTTVIGYISSSDTFLPSKDFGKIKRELVEDIYLNKDNLVHKQIWDVLNAFSKQFSFNSVEHIYTHIPTNTDFYSMTQMMEKLKYRSSGMYSDEVKQKAADERKKRGGDIGTIVHGITEANLKQLAKDIAGDTGYGFEDSVVSKIELILRQFKGTNVTILSEVLVSDVDLRLAGTIDMLIIDENNKLHIYDFKTKEKGFSDYLKVTKYGNSQAYSEKERHAIQMSGYKDMLEKMTGLEVATLNVIPLVPTLNKDNIIIDITLDKTHSSNGIITVPYNYSVNPIYSVLKVKQGKSLKDDFADSRVGIEDRDKIDEDLKQKFADITKSQGQLTTKQIIIEKSITALLHKRDVLFRTGKKSEIGAQEKLIEDLLDEADVEKQLYQLIDFANKSANRIWVEYENYKKEGKLLPLRLLYAWRDSVSAFDALTNEKEGLLNVLNKEHGFSGGPEYRDELRKTVERINAVKSLYIAEGLDQLIDFLVPYYNKFYAAERLLRIKEYRRKKFKGEIKNNMTESEYVDHALDENKQTLEQRTKEHLRVEIKKAGRDIGVLTRWLDNVLDSADPVTAAMVKAFAFADEESRIAAITNRDEMVSMVRNLENWYNKQGRIPKSNEEFYSFMLEKDSEGRPTGHYITEYTSDMMKEYRDIRTAARDLETGEQRKAFISAWLEENMPLNKVAFVNAYWEFIGEQNSLGFISDADFTILEQNALYATNKLTVEEMKEKGILGFEVAELLNDWLGDHTWDFRSPVEKWQNPQFKQLKTILDTKEDPRGDFYRYILKLRREADSAIPFGFRLDTRLPGVIKQNHERINSGQSIGSIIKGAISDELTFKIDDTHRIHEEIVDESNNAKYFLPIHFTGQITKEIIKEDKEGNEYKLRVFDPDEQSFDLATIYHKYWYMAHDYHVKSDILPQMELAKYMINNRTTIKRNSFGDAIFKKRSKSDTRSESTMEESTINNSQLAQQVNDWFLSCVYGVQEQDAGKIGKYDVGKIFNFINKYTSLNLLGLNVVAGTANIILGETLQRIESFAGEYMNPKDFLYADKFYLRTMKGMIGDIGSRDAHGLGTHLVEFFGVFDDYGESDMDMRSKALQLFEINTFYATSHLGEHYMQTRFLFGLLANKRAINDKGEDIGRMIDQYELINNKLVLKKEVNLIKSKWTENDVLEFKSKTRGILSRLHGEYGALGKVAIQRMAIGRMAYLFRHFVVPGFRRRWGKEQYIERLGQYVEGNYITTGKFVGVVGTKIFGKREDHEEESFFSRLIGNLQSFKLSMVGEEWVSLTDHQKANIYRTLYEVSFLILSVILANILAGIKPDPDDDDEATKKYWAFVMYQTYRLQNEILFFINPNSTMSIMRSPMASMSVVENLIKLTSQMFDPTAVYENGAWKGRPKIFKTLNDMVPLQKQYYRLQDITGQIPWMSKSGFGGKNKQEDANTAYTTP